MTLAQLRALPTRELDRRCDVMVQADRGISALGAEDYLAERERRVAERQSRRLEWLTWALVALTIVIAVATLALLVRGE
jgi:hypothetical protein